MIDRETEQKVWQRVLGQAPQEDDLLRLIHLCTLQAEDFCHLNPEWYRAEKRTLGLLTGLYFLEAGKNPTFRSTPPLSGSRASRLRRCRDRCQEMLMLCVRLETHPRYGALFTDLTRHRRALCASLAQTFPTK